MKDKKFRMLRVLISVYVSSVVAVGVSLSNPWLVLGGVVTGFVCLWLVKKKLAVKTSDERTEHLSGRAAIMTYSIVSSALALVSLFLLFVAQNEPYLQSVGIILSYITLTMIGVFATLYQYYLNQES